jgi:hypothetical protein
MKHMAELKPFENIQSRGTMIQQLLVRGQHNLVTNEEPFIGLIFPALGQVSVLVVMGNDSHPGGLSVLLACS